MVSQTVGALIQAAAEELQVVNSGGSLTTNEKASAIDRLQRLIDGAGVQRPLIFGERLDSLTLVPNQQSYTIGKDPTAINIANFDVPWPTKIRRANLLLSTTVRRPLRIFTPEQWAAVRYQQVTGPPQGLYFDRNFGTNGGALSGFGTMRFYMIPDQAYAWEMYSWQQQPSVALTTDLLNYPPGYADFWLYSAVVRLASMFGTEPTATQIQLLRDARDAITTENTPSPELTGGDGALIGNRDAALYNWLDGTSEDY